MPALKTRILPLGLFLTVALFGCASSSTPGPGSSESSAEGTPVRGGTLVVGLLGDVDSWNPYTTHDATAAGILDLLYPRLLLETGGQAGRPSFEPWLAHSWEFSSDGRELTFHLRPQAVWSDGSPVSCSDVRFTYQAQLDDALAWSGSFIKGRLTHIDCPDPHTAVFRYDRQLNEHLGREIMTLQSNAKRD